MKRHAVALCTAMLCAVILSGCSHLSVKHLNKGPWTFSEPQTVATKCWRFEYRVAPVSKYYRIDGTAFPLAESVPEWATWIDDLWISAYLTDARGRILARDVKVYVPQHLSREQGVPFEFWLRLDDQKLPEPLFVSFGYRVKMLAAAQKASADKDMPPVEDVFFASEGALVCH